MSRYSRKQTGGAELVRQAPRPAELPQDSAEQPAGALYEPVAATAPDTSPTEGAVRDVGRDALRFAQAYALLMAARS